LLLARYVDFDFLSQVFSLCAGHSNTDRYDLVRLDVELVGVKGESRLLARFLFKSDESSDTAFVLELDLLVAGLSTGDEAHVDKGLELDVSSGLESMQVKLEWVGVSFTANLDHVVEVALRVTLKLNVKSDGETGSNVTDVFVVAAEV